MKGQGTQIIGIDFSTSKDDIGGNLCITEGTVGSEEFDVKQCSAAEDEFGDEGRDLILNKLCETITSRSVGSHTVVGLDFPFGLPYEVLPDEVIERNEWRTLLDIFAQEYGNSPRDMESECKKKAKGVNGNKKYYRRTTDENNQALSPYHFMGIKHLTYHGIRSVIIPIEDQVCFLPMDERDSGKPWVIEVYPATTLRSLQSDNNLQHDHKRYKEGTRKALRKRKQIIDTIEPSINLTRGDREFILSNHNALDSLLAAYATFEAVKDGYDRPKDDEWCPVEGYIHA